MADESSTGEASGGPDAPVTEEVDEVVELKDSVCVGPFKMEILKGRAARAPAYHTYVMIAPLRHAEVEGGKAHPLPPGLQVLHAYTMLTAGSKHVSIMVQNMTDSAIFLKKGVCVWCMWYQQHWCLKWKCHQKKMLKAQKCLKNDCLSRSNRKR